MNYVDYFPLFTHRPVSEITQTESNYEMILCQGLCFPSLRPCCRLKRTMENYIFSPSCDYLPSNSSFIFLCLMKSATQHDMIITHNDSLFCTNKTVCEANKHRTLQIKNFHLSFIVFAFAFIKDGEKGKS